MTEQPLTSFSIPVAVIEKPRYLTCGCGSILGYIGHEGKALMLHIYAYPPSAIRDNMGGKRINGRILSGDVWCPRCRQWVPWNASAERPWKK